MDKKPYYRLLGLTEGATAAQIKDAYEKKMHKLRSDDYADDPEYVARKTREVRHAYSVLTGGAAPVSRAQKEAGFEKWKAAQDEGEDVLREAKKAFRMGTSKLKAFGHNAVCDLDEEAEEKGSRVFGGQRPGTKKPAHSDPPAEAAEPAAEAGRRHTTRPMSAVRKRRGKINCEIRSLQWQ